MSKAEEKAIRRQILVAALEQQLQETDEAKISRMQRALAYQQQEEEFKFQNEQRDAARVEMGRDARLNADRHRPSYVVYTDIYFDQEEEAWACRHSGVVAYGDTPSMACENFDYLWTFGK
jgi:hypothetical protein